MIARGVWWAGLACVAVLTTALQFDFKARSAPQFAALVPEPLRNNAQVGIVRQAGQDGERALAEAEKLVRRRPVPAEYLTLLAAGQARAGQTEAAVRTLQVAGRRGWREPVAQLGMLRLALAAGDRPEAARRYAALFLRGETPDALLEELGPEVLAGRDNPGRDTLVAVVVGGERWHGTFLRRGSRVMPPDAFAAIAAESIRRGATFDCTTLDASLRQLRLRDAGAAEPIVAVAAGRCPALAAQGDSRSQGADQP